MKSITDNEAKVLEVCLNYCTREGQLQDNCSAAGFKDFMKILGWNEKQVGGIVTSLQSKGMGYLETDEECFQSGHFYKIFHLSEKGINTIFDYKERKSY